MKTPNRPPDSARRKLLKALGLAPAGAAALTVAAPVHATLPEAPAETPEGSRGYHETEHIRTYYRTAALM